MPKTLVKGDENSMKALASLNEIFGKLKEQADQGQIDGALLDQAGAVLNVAMDSAPTPHDANDEIADNVAGQDVQNAADDAPSLPNIPKEVPEAVASPEKDTNPSEVAPAMDEEPTEDTEDSEDNEMSEPKSDVNKGGLPAQGRPPIKSYTNAPNLMFSQDEAMRANLGPFVKALEGGNLREAQRVAGNSQFTFDTMMNMGMRAVLTEGGWTTDNMSKLGGMAQFDPNSLSKAFTAASVPGIYLLRLAKMMLPVYAGITNRLPTQSPQSMAGTVATWRSQLGFGALPEANVFRTVEAGIGPAVPTNFLTFNAPFIDAAYSDSVTLKAIATGRGYSDPLQLSVIKTMSAVLRTQERMIIGHNSAAIAKPTSVTLAQSTAGTTALAAGSYVVGVTALTYEGWLNASVGGSATTGETAATYSGSLISTAGSPLTITWPAVPGAVAYNVFLNSGSAITTGSPTYNKTVTINKAILTGYSGSAALLPVAADTTVNATYGMEGLIPWCENSTVYSNAIPGKVNVYDNAGGGLTAANGGIVQIDNLLVNQWTNWHIAPSVMIMSPNMNATLVGKIMGLNNGATYRIEVSQERGGINGGMMLTGYTNKFAAFADGSPRYIDVIPHPYVPDGTILLLAETIPYPMGNETRGFVRDTLLPYTYFPLASNTIQYNYSITTSFMLECFNPSPQAAVVGVDVSL